jgi:hypothetical protein
MTPAAVLLLTAVFASPVLAYLIYRAEEDLRFFDPPVDRPSEPRLQILAARSASLIFLHVFLFGRERRRPRAWIAFGLSGGLARVFFDASGVASARALRRLRRDQGSGVQVKHSLGARDGGRGPRGQGRAASREVLWVEKRELGQLAGPGP